MDNIVCVCVWTSFLAVQVARVWRLLWAREGSFVVVARLFCSFSSVFTAPHLLSLFCWRRRRKILPPFPPSLSRSSCNPERTHRSFAGMSTHPPPPLDSLPSICEHSGTKCIEVASEIYEPQSLALRWVRTRLSQLTTPVGGCQDSGPLNLVLLKPRTV